MSANAIESAPGTSNCSTGTLTFSAIDADNNLAVSPGDSYSVASDACSGGLGWNSPVLGSESGTLSTLVGSIGRSSPYLASFQLRQQGFGIDLSGKNSFTNTVPLTLSVARVDYNQRTTIIDTSAVGSMSFDMTALGSSRVVSREIQSTHFVIRTAPVNGYIESFISGKFAITGAVYDRKGSGLTITIERELAPRQAGNESHGDGLITITASDGSKAQIEFYSVAGISQVHTKLDADGNGVYEKVETGLPTSFRL
jgi:hypothetical protein